MTANLVSNTVKQAMGASNTRKLDDMAKETVNYHDEKNKLTTDYGVKISNTDDWLKVATEDKTGPMLLEDPFGREKVIYLTYQPAKLIADCFKDTSV